jgi:hypothetical protein
MRELLRWAFGVLTVWPGLYFVAFIFTIAVSFSENDQAERRLTEVTLPFHIAAMAALLVLIPAYVTHAYRNSRLDSERRTQWIIMLLAGSIVAMPVYWWLYIRTARPPGSTHGGAEVKRSVG